MVKPDGTQEKEQKGTSSSSSQRGIKDDDGAFNSGNRLYV